MSTILIKNATVVNEGFQKLKDVFIVGEYIQQIGTDLNIEADQIIDATGKHLLPGLIDDQVHFREPGLTHKATIGSESRAAVAGGITSFIEMPNTNPQATNIIELEKKFDRASETSLANYSFMFGGTNDNIEEIRKLDKSKVAGLKLFLGSSTGNMLVDDQAVLREIFSNTNLLISVHCEDEATVRANFAAYKERYGEDIPIEAHPEIRSHEACYLSSSRAIALAKETGARLHVFHLSTAQETDLFRNDIPLNEKKITAEVCVHHLWFSSEDYKTKGTLIKWNPAVKNQVDQDALWKALNDDRIDVLATDHAPHTKEEKNNKYASAPSGGPLVQHALLALLTAVGKGKISIEKLVQKACHNPAILFEIEKRGYVKEGFYADLVLVDLNKKTLVTEESLLYQCKWSPFEGETFEAKIDTTWVNGSCVYDKGIVIEKKAAKRLTFNR
ncbi:MAG: dihydroorotase [Flavobacteriales bacterium]|jgi:dihydroorotase|nr:dihydroorotase [Flavobacteriaceae bacterium]MDO7582360.1 dihydroorotase [Flavobacteriaceae bacterium]MDO7592109.1 dihydroorotase [Flavobacteriaceae bacterium]MDO7599992.1 dihydroorotase [Flavobacteriaceae bacterium]MDO7602631.1 dihydroorotase [Flavobacteriaceae bacterium]|tara:strand:- start:146 stop:1480 length:1335 start_codon:yes stop_codon:yes gene_type:complete